MKEMTKFRLHLACIVTVVYVILYFMCQELKYPCGFLAVIGWVASIGYLLVAHIKDKP